MKTMHVKQIFVDTNILIYSTNASSSLQHISLNALEKARNQDVELFVSHQILREYLAAATRIRISGSNVTLEEIIENVQKFQAEFTVLEERDVVLARLIELIQESPTAGKQIHDANVVATMLVHGIEHLLTHNVDDFSRFSGKITILPLEEWIRCLHKNP